MMVMMVVVTPMGILMMLEINMMTITTMIIMRTTNHFGGDTLTLKNYMYAQPKL
jgi:hypothetical protein